jgi:DNA repair exonuclease SbcCD ATPase subunit
MDVPGFSDNVVASVDESERTLPIASHKPNSQLPLQDALKNPADDLNKFYAGRAAAEDEFAPDNSDKTVAVTGFQNLRIENHDDKVKVSIGQNRSAYSSGYASWGGGAEASLGQAENLRIAQEKILELERENEKLRAQNDELISASEIIKERSDLLTAQIVEFKNDKDGLEESFKNEIALLKGHLHRKEAEFQKAQIKIDDLESRLKFDMKKIRVRERELENRLELIRAEKNAVTKSKDEQILDLRRKMDVLQMEVDSYRQKCVDLNKLLENNQDSFKRTTRALRLAMANLELQEENKAAVNVALKKVD